MTAPQDKSPVKNVLAAALEYHRRGWSIIPIMRGTKRPTLRSWKRYQETPPTEKQVRAWFSNGHRNIGILCGAVSGGMTVIDFDAAELYQQWKADNPDLAAALPTVRTGRGFHVYAVTNETKARKLDGIDIKASGYVVAPPSVHETGTTYRWTVPLNGQPLPEITLKNLRLPQDATKTPLRPLIDPTGLSKTLHSSRGCVVGGLDDVIRETLPVAPGQRNHRIFLLAQRLKSEFDTPEAARPVVEQWFNAARSVIKTKDFEITWIDFNVAWKKVKFPAGSGKLGRAVMAARKRLEAGDGIEQTDFESEAIRLLLEVCFELSKLEPDSTFFMSKRTAGKIVKQSHETGGNLRNKFCDLGYMERVQTERKQRDAIVYRWKGRQ